MHYTIITTTRDTNGETTTTTTTITAPNAQQAHAQLPTLPTGATRRVYPTTTDMRGNPLDYNIMRGALQVAKTIAHKTINRTGGTGTLRRIADDLTIADMRASNLDGNANKLLSILGDMDADSNDFVGYACQGIMEGISERCDIVEQYKRGYKCVNEYIMARRAITSREASIEYIVEQGGDMVAISAYMARLIKGGDRYTPQGNNTMDATTASRLGEVLQGAFTILTERQKEVIYYTVKGMSQRQIAEKLRVKSKRTIADHIVYARLKIADYIADTAPEFLAIIDDAQVKAIAQVRRTHRDK